MEIFAVGGVASALVPANATRGVNSLPHPECGRAGVDPFTDGTIRYAPDAVQLVLGVVTVDSCEVGGMVGSVLEPEPHELMASSTSVTAAGRKARESGHISLPPMRFRTALQTVLS